VENFDNAIAFLSRYSYYGKRISGNKYRMDGIQRGVTKQLDDLMNAQMSRVEFLRYMGVVALGMIGITGLLKNLHHAVPKSTRPMKSFATGYGRGAYGR
jgi:hypothetical protein